jgi:hypothetical protein
MRYLYDKFSLTLKDWSRQIDLPNLTIEKVRKQLETGCLIIPGSKYKFFLFLLFERSKKGHHLLYMRPARYFAKDNLDDLLRSLVYLLERMTERESTATEGLSFMANMEDWGWSNFSIKYAKSFFDTVQVPFSSLFLIVKGRFPCRVRMFLIVNPPSWFNMVWRLIRPMMSSQFAGTYSISWSKFSEKVSMPQGKEIFEHFDADQVPKELGGELDIDAALSVFIRHRYEVEGVSFTEEAPSIASPKMLVEKSQ